MKRKIALAVLSAVALFSAALGLIACSDSGQAPDIQVDGDFVWTTESAYDIASDLGYDGTLEEFVALISGNDGVGIASVSVNSSGELIVVLTDKQSINCGKVVGVAGEDGQDGQDGVGISKAETDKDGNLILYLTNGTTVNCGKVTGEDGEDGQDGVGISETKVDENGNLIVTLTDGRVYDLGKVTGAEGMSAYEIYLKYHPNYTGTEEQWIRDLVSGKLEMLDYSTIEYIPELNYTVAAGEEIVLPEEINVYFTNGDVQFYTVDGIYTLNLFLKYILDCGRYIRCHIISCFGYSKNGRPAVRVCLKRY